jgi:hypothetical protein
MDDAVNQKNNNNNKKLSKALSTNLSIEDYNSFLMLILMLTKIEYEAGLIKEESTSELFRFTIHHILNQVHNQPEYLLYSNKNNNYNLVQNLLLLFQ